MRNNPALDADVETRRRRADQRDHFRRSPRDTMPLVFKRFNWKHGVYSARRWASETTAAATGGRWARSAAIRWRCCRSAATTSGDYFGHWLGIGKQLTIPPRIFHVNWFRKGADGKFLWPGFGENMRVLKWIIDRCEGSGGALKSPIGWLPSPHDLDLAELDIDHIAVDELLCLDHEEWQKEIAAHKEYFDSLGGVVPEELQKQREQLVGGSSCSRRPVATPGCNPGKTLRFA